MKRRNPKWDEKTKTGKYGFPPPRTELKHDSYDSFLSVSEKITESTRKSGFTIYIPDSAKVSDEQKNNFYFADYILRIAKSEALDDSQKLSIISDIEINLPTVIINALIYYHDYAIGKSENAKSKNDELYWDSQKCEVRRILDKTGN